MRRALAVVVFFFLSAGVSAEERPRPSLIVPPPGVPSFVGAHPIGLADVARLVPAADLAIARARVRATALSDDAKAAWLQLAPTLGFSAGYGRMDGFAVSPFGSIGRHFDGAVAPYGSLKLDVNPVSASLGGASASRDAAAAVASSREVGGIELLAATEAYLELERAQAIHAVRTAALRSSEQLVAIASALERAGTGPASDVLRAQTQVARQRVALAGAEGDMLMASHALAFRLHLPPHGLLVAADRELRVESWVPDCLDPADLLDRAAAHRPELEVWKHQAAAARHRRAQSIASLAAPTVAAFYKLGDTTTDVSDLVGVHGTYGVGVYWTLSLAQSLALKAAGGRLRDAELAVTAAEARVAREVMDAAAAVESSRTALAPALDAVASASEALKLTEVRYRAGTGSAIEIIEAQKDLDAARLALVDALVASNRAQVQLLASTGELDARALTSQR